VVEDDRGDGAFGWWQHRQASAALDEPAGGPLAVADVEQRRRLDPAAVERQRAARMEAATARDVGGIGCFADEDRPLAPLPGRWRRRRRRDADECLRVGVVRIAD